MKTVEIIIHPLLVIPKKAAGPLGFKQPGGLSLYSDICAVRLYSAILLIFHMVLLIRYTTLIGYSLLEIR